MTTPDRAWRVIVLAATLLSAASLLMTADVTLGAPLAGTPSGTEAPARSWPLDPTAAQQADQTIPMFVNPSRRVLYPGEQVLISVGDDWLRTSLTWNAAWSSGSLMQAGWLSAERGPYVQYTAPNASGYVQIIVSGVLYGRSGVGYVEFYIQQQ